MESRLTWNWMKGIIYYKVNKKSTIKFYLLTVCDLLTVTPSQVISENTEDDQTNKGQSSSNY